MRCIRIWWAHHLSSTISLASPLLLWKLLNCWSCPLITTFYCRRTCIKLIDCINEVDVASVTDLETAVLKCQFGILAIATLVFWSRKLRYLDCFVNYCFQSQE